MRITMIGTGYVGLVSGACFADFGHEVICVDKATDKIEALRSGSIPIYEPGLEALVAKNCKEERLHFSLDLKQAVGDADAVFIAVGTPSRRGDRHADLSYVHAAAEEIAPYLKDGAVVVTKSTVPVGTGNAVYRLIRQLQPELEFSVASNPEFLREGTALEDFRRPDWIVIGCDEERSEKVLREIYRPLDLYQSPIICMPRRSAELTKHAANAFLATKISFINEMADLSDVVGADVQAVARGIDLHNRIGSKFLHAGPGYGESCFPKVKRALLKTAQDHGAYLRIIESVVRASFFAKGPMKRWKGRKPQSSSPNGMRFARLISNARSNCSTIWFSSICRMSTTGPMSKSMDLNMSASAVDQHPAQFASLSS